MGAPDYTTKDQNAAILAASEMAVEQLSNTANQIGAAMFTLRVPTHGVAAARIPLH